MLITLSQGSGGRAGNQLIEEEIVSRFGNGPLAGLPDGALLPGGLVFSTDSFVVTPRFFPGGNIGKLAVCGTVNDLCVAGGIPRYLSLAVILEEGLPREEFAKILDAVAAANERYPYLFSTESDSDTYSWLSELGCFSPIVHLQQTDGKSSAHQPFDEKCNAAGIIKGEKLLPAIAEAYRKIFADMPEKCPEICLTLEVFAGTAELPVDILNKVKDSAAYWRQFIPEDGMPLDELLKRL